MYVRRRWVDEHKGLGVCLRGRGGDIRSLLRTSLRCSLTQRRQRAPHNPSEVPSVPQWIPKIAWTDYEERQFLGSGLAERIFRGIFFEQQKIVSRILSQNYFSSFCGEKVPRKTLQENAHENPPEFILQKSPTHFCRGAGPTVPKNERALFAPRVAQF